MKLPRFIKKTKATISMSIGKIALRQAHKNCFVLASLILNIGYIFKLIISIGIIYLIFFTDISPKNAPNWLVTIEMLTAILLCFVVFISTKHHLEMRKEIKKLKSKT